MGMLHVLVILADETNHGHLCYNILGFSQLANCPHSCMPAPTTEYATYSLVEGRLV